MKVTKNIFKNEAQYKKFCRIREFFERLIELEKTGHLFFVDNEFEETPFIDGYKIGFKKSKYYKTLFVGDEFFLNKKTKEYDIPYISYSLRDIKKKIKVFKQVKI